MEKRRIRTISEEQKMTIQLWIGTLLCLFGVGMLIASFCVPPMGVIHSSVLAAVGETFTFSGALIGIDYTYKLKRIKFEDERHYGNRFKGDTDDIADDKPLD